MILDRFLIEDRVDTAEGREMTHRELGARILDKLEKDLADISEVELRPRMEGNQLFTIFQPKRHKKAEGSKPTADGSNHETTPRNEPPAR